MMWAVSTTFAPPCALRSSVQSIRVAEALFSHRTPAFLVRTTQQPRAVTQLAPLQRTPAPPHSATAVCAMLALARSVTNTPDPQRWPSQQPCMSTLAVPNTPTAA